MKDFDKWNKEKKQVNNKIPGYDFFFHAREIWWCSVGVNVGVETDGKNNNFERPVLILKKFNKEHFWGIPLTTNEKEGDFYQKIKHNKGTSWAILSQIRSFSTKRLLRKIGRISEDELLQIKSKIKCLI
jgi:mRNA interferase MazF